MKKLILLTLIIALNANVGQSIDSLLLSRADTLSALQAELIELDSLSKRIEQRSIDLRNKLIALPTFSLSKPLVSINGETPVIIEFDTIWIVSTGVGVLDAHERANGISNRINKLIKLETFDSELFEIKNDENNTLVEYDGNNLFSLSDIDALAYNTTRLDLAHRIKNSILLIVTHHNAIYKSEGFLFKIIGVAITVISLIVLIKLILLLFKKLKIKVIALKKTRLSGLKIKDIEVVNAEQEVRLALIILNIIKLVLIVSLFYIALPIGFSFFAFTQGWSNLLLGYITNPLSKAGYSIINYIPSLITIIVIYLITRFFIQFLKILFQKLEKDEIKLPGFFPEWAMPTFRIISGIAYVFMFIVIFPYLPGSDSPIFKGVSVFLGVLFSLGSTSAIANLVAGLVITYMRPFKIGDRVQIGDVLGNVVEKNLLVTRVLTPKNEEVTIPNASILNVRNINFSTTAHNLGLILHTDVTIGYDVPWETVHKLLIEAAENTKGINLDKKPFVLQTSLNDFYITYELNVYTSRPKFMALIYSRLHQSIQDSFNKGQVEILSPHYKVNRYEDDKSIGNATLLRGKNIEDSAKEEGKKEDKS